MLKVVNSKRVDFVKDFNPFYFLLKNIWRLKIKYLSLSFNLKIFIMELKKPIIFFDLETTGVNVLESRIVQIATVKINTDKSVEEKHYLINPLIPIPKKAIEVHGITDEMVESQPTFREYAKNLKKYFEGCDIGGYNSNKFDIPLLIEEFKRCNIEFSAEGRTIIDVFVLEKHFNPRTLSGVYKKYMGKELDGAHTALMDVRATIDVFYKQIEQYSLPTSVEDIDTLLLGGNKRVDVAGRLCMIEDEICWTFGKHKGKPIKDNPGYIKWYLSQPVPTETQNIILNIIKE